MTKKVINVRFGKSQFWPNLRFKQLKNVWFLKSPFLSFSKLVSAFLPIAVGRPAGWFCFVKYCRLCLSSQLWEKPREARQLFLSFYTPPIVAHICFENFIQMFAGDKMKILIAGQVSNNMISWHNFVIIISSCTNRT